MQEGDLQFVLIVTGIGSLFLLLWIADPQAQPRWLVAGLGLICMVLGVGTVFQRRSEARDMADRSATSMLRIDLGPNPVETVAAALDLAIRTAFPEVLCVVPSVFEDGRWRQPGKRLKLELDQLTDPWARELVLISTRAPAVVTTVKGVVERALYAGVDLRDPAEQTLLRAAGARASLAPDPPEPILMRLAHVADVGFSGFFFVFLVGLTAFVTFAAPGAVAAGNLSLSDPRTYLAFAAFLTIDFGAWVILMGEWGTELGGWRKWPPESRRLSAAAPVSSTPSGGGSEPGVARAEPAEGNISVWISVQGESAPPELQAALGAKTANALAEEVRKRARAQGSPGMHLTVKDNRRKSHE